MQLNQLGSLTTLTLIKVLTMDLHPRKRPQMSKFPYQNMCPKTVTPNLDPYSYAATSLQLLHFISQTLIVQAFTQLYILTRHSHLTYISTQC